MVNHVQQIEELGFGKCRLCVQVPDKGNIQSVDDLVGNRLVTSFERLTGEYFASLDQQHSQKTAVNYISGSVEAACSLGLADGIGNVICFHVFPNYPIIRHALQSLCSCQHWL
jgi:ATP phosphoribosyltransferase